MKTAEGQTLVAPPDWVLLPPGDAALSRRVKAEGPSWTVKEKRGRRAFSRGIWAPRERVERLRAALEVERADPAYQRKLESGRRRREQKEQVYAEDFEAAVLRYLDFCETHRELARRMARAIAAHAVPVGSGTVARTQRIPIERRAEAATIAWMRHQTTAYDDMSIPRVKGMRREVRRALAQRSKALLRAYREGTAQNAGGECPLRQALGDEAFRRKGVQSEAASTPVANRAARSSSNTPGPGSRRALGRGATRPNLGTPLGSDPLPTTQRGARR